MIVHKSRHLRINAQDYRPAMAAVATVGAPQRLELLTLDRGAAMSSLARHGGQRRAVHEGRDGHVLSSENGIGPSDPGQITSLDARTRHPAPVIRLELSGLSRLVRSGGVPRRGGFDLRNICRATSRRPGQVVRKVTVPVF